MVIGSEVDGRRVGAAGGSLVNGQWVSETFSDSPLVYLRNMSFNKL